MKTLKIDFGALVPKLRDQIKAQGVVCPIKGALEKLQKLADAILRLSIRGIITESERDKARKRLMKEIDLWIKEKDKS